MPSNCPGEFTYKGQIKKVWAGTEDPLREPAAAGVTHSGLSPTLVLPGRQQRPMEGRGQGASQGRRQRAEPLTSLSSSLLTSIG